MKTKLPDWSDGVENTLRKYNAYLPDPYSWLGISEDGQFIFIPEADHIDKPSSIVKLKEGYIERIIAPASKDWHPNSIRHAAEVLSAVKLAYVNEIPVKVLLTRNSKYSQTPDKPIRAMLLPWDFNVLDLHGDSIDEGFSYSLGRI